MSTRKAVFAHGNSSQGTRMPNGVIDDPADAVTDLVRQLVSSTDEMIREMEMYRFEISLSGRISSLSNFTLVSLIELYKSYTDAADTSELTVLAGLTRGALETLADYLFVVNNDDPKRLSGTLQRQLRFNAHLYQESVALACREMNIEEQCKPPHKWTKATQSERIFKSLGSQERHLYSVLCAFTHHSMPTQDLFVYYNDIYYFRYLFLIRLISYLYVFAQRTINTESVRSKKTLTALRRYVATLEKLQFNPDDLIEKCKEIRQVTIPERKPTKRNSRGPHRNVTTLRSYYIFNGRHPESTGTQYVIVPDCAHTAFE